MQANGYAYKAGAARFLVGKRWKDKFFSCWETVVGLGLEGLLLGGAINIWALTEGQVCVGAGDFWWGQGNALKIGSSFLY
jgi:hypothetical protein